YQGEAKWLIRAVGGGRTGCHVRAWKCLFQEKLCDAFGLTVTVCHYPTGCSKWNPVEHRLFSYISKNWEGKPLKTLGIMLGYIRGTSTNTGLAVQAFLDEGTYRKAQKWTRHGIEPLGIVAHVACPGWNYTLPPRSKLGCEGLGTASPIATQTYNVWTVSTAARGEGTIAYPVAV